MQIVAADIGGTHARFALAELADGARPRLGEMRKYRTREHAGLAEVWAKFARDSGGELPRDAALAVAAPIEGDTLTFMNSDWRIAALRHRRRAWARAADPAQRFRRGRPCRFGDGRPTSWFRSAAPATCPPTASSRVLGTGTGLGVAILDRRGGAVRVIETEAAHIGFCSARPRGGGARPTA